MARHFSAQSDARPLHRLATLGVVAALAGATALVATAAPADAATTRSLTAKFAATSALTSRTVLVTGALNHSPKATAVAVQRLSGRAWTTVRTVRTGATGRFATTAPMPGTAGTYSFRAFVPATRTLRAAASATTRITVRRPVSISLSATRTSVPTGTRLAFRTTATPFARGGRVTLQRSSGSTWVTAGTAALSSSGTASFAPVAASTAGSSSYRAVTPVSATLTAGVSPTVRIVTTATTPNPPPVTSSGMTLSASSATVGAGGTVTLSGTAQNIFAGNTVVINRVLAGALQPLTTTPETSTGTFFVTVSLSTATTYRATIAARGSIPAASSGDVTVAVAGMPVAPVITPGALPAGTVGAAYTVTLTTEGNTAGTWTASGTTPFVLSATGVLSGTPTSAGDVRFQATFTATATGLSDTAALVIHSDSAPVTPTTGPTIVSAGDSHTCRIKPDHTLWCWGNDIHSQLGEPVDLKQPYEKKPVQVGTAATWTAVSAGSVYDTCAVRADYTAWCWGWNTNGEAGTGAYNEQVVPGQVSGDQHWRTVTVGDASACGLTTAGTLWCWGSAAGTVQSDGSIPDASIPTQVGTSADWTDVSAGAYNTCAVKNDGSLWCWGPNYQGQLGNGTTGGPAVYVPTRVGPSTTWASVDVGSGTVCGIRTDGSLWCWGLNRDGEVGDGTTTDRNVPQPVGVGYVWTTVSIGYEHVCAIRADASLWCWGDNSNGAVGDGTTVHRSVPTPVVGSAGWTSVAVGGQHACAVRVDGTQWCWGSNQYGQLGIDASPSAGVSVPTKVVG